MSDEYPPFRLDMGAKEVDRVRAAVGVSAAQTY
jgi:hypothetical protein